MFRYVTCFVILGSLAAAPAMAYVGPGSSLGAIGVAFGIVGVVVLSLISFLWYPIKRMHRTMRNAMARRREADD